MRLFRRAGRDPIECPICGAQVGTATEALESGHFLTHLEDRRGGRIGLRCGHPEAEWPTAENFPDLAVRHLRDVHGVPI